MSKYSNRVISLSVCIAIVFSIFTPFRFVVQGGQALSMLIPIIFITGLDNMFKRKMFWYALSICAIWFWLGQNGVEYFQGRIPNIIQFMLAILCLEHYVMEKDRIFARHVLFVMYSSLMIMTVVSIPQFIAMPNLSRMMNAALKDPTIEFNYYWAISYDTIHNIPIYALPLIAWYKESTKLLTRTVLIVSIALLALVMIFADATTPLIMMVMAIAIFMIYNHKHSKGRNIMKFIFLSILCLPLMSKTIMNDLLITIQPVFQGSSTFKKIDEMVIYLNEEKTTGDLEGREERYSTTIESLVENPFMPEHNRKRIGLHSYILDHMAAMGLLLFIPFAWFLWKLYKNDLRILRQFRQYEKFAWFLFILMGLFKNFFLLYSTSFIVPIFLSQLEHKTNKK